MKARIEILELSGGRKMLKVADKKNRTIDTFDIFEQNFKTVIKCLLQLEGIRCVR